MKEGWSNCKIGDICSITDFVSNGSFASLKENVKYYNSPNYAVLVRLADASNGFDKSKFVYTDEHGYDFSKKSHLHGGELIMSNVGSVGSMFICPVMKQPMTLAPNTISITSQNNRFLYYYFLSDGFKAKLKGITSSTTLKKFNKTNFKLLEICIPSLSEQQSIVDYLDSAFAKIDAMKANAEKALNEAKALFQSSLKEMLEPKEGWEEKTLNETAKYRRGSFPQPYGNKEWYDGEGSMPFVQVAELQEDSFNLVPVTKRLISKIAQPLSVFVPAGTVLVTLQGSIGKVAITDYDSYVDRTIAIFQDYKIAIDKTFFAYQLKIRFEIERLKARGTTIKTITKEEFANFIINCPPLSEQQSIVETPDSLKSKVDRLQENYEKISQECDALKQAILRQVFE